MSFGAMTINNITECTCSDSRLLDMTGADKKTLSLLVTAGTQVKATANSEYGITTGMSAVGNYTSGGASCLVYSGEECNSEGSPQGTITLIGTSAN